MTKGTPQKCYICPSVEKSNICKGDIQAEHYSTRLTLGLSKENLLSELENVKEVD